MTSDVDLTRVASWIHDQWFDLDQVIHDADRSELRPTIYPGRQSGGFFKVARAPSTEQLPVAIGELIVRNVAAVTIRDDAGIGWFDIGGLAFDPGTNQVRLWSNFPLEICIQVRKLDVALVPQ